MAIPLCLQGFSKNGRYSKITKKLSFKAFLRSFLRISRAPYLFHYPCKPGQMKRNGKTLYFPRNVRLFSLPLSHSCPLKEFENMFVVSTKLNPLEALLPEGFYFYVVPFWPPEYGNGVRKFVNFYYFFFPNTENFSFASSRVTSLS